MSKPPITANEPVWLDLCASLGVDPQQRLTARLSVLEHPAALDACLYRPDEQDPEAEELDLGDARVLLEGTFAAPAEWDADTREAYFDGSDPADFHAARIEVCARPGSRAFFQPQPGDYVALSLADGSVQMYYLYESLEQDDGLHVVLIREDDAL